MSGWELIPGSPSTDNETAKSVVADCTAGKRALGGGFIVSNASAPGEVVITGSYPSDNDTWTATGTLDATTGGDESYSLTAYVICANVT